MAAEQLVRERRAQLSMTLEEAEALSQWLGTQVPLPPVGLALLAALTELLARADLAVTAEVPVA